MAALHSLCTVYRLIFLKCSAETSGRHIRWSVDSLRVWADPCCLALSFRAASLGWDIDFLMSLLTAELCKITDVKWSNEIQGHHLDVSWCAPSAARCLIAYYQQSYPGCDKEKVTKENLLVRFFFNFVCLLTQCCLAKLYWVTCQLTLTATYVWGHVGPLF